MPPTIILILNTNCNKKITSWRINARGKSPVLKIENIVDAELA